MVRRVEALSPVVNQPSKLRLTMDDGTAMTIPATLVADYGLFQGQTLEQPQWEALQAAIRQASARERAVRIVAASAVSARDLEQRLVQKGEEAQSAADAVQWLQELGAVNDEELALRLVRQGAARGYGKARIRQLLYQKGIGRELWDAALETMPQMDEALDAFLQKRLQGRQPDQKLLQKTVQALQRRGYSWEEIQRGIRRYEASLEAE